MLFLTDDECRQWLADRSRTLPNARKARAAWRAGFPDSPYQFFWWAHAIVTSIAQGQPCLLWMTEWSIWPSSENWHLYRRLRRSYGDGRTLHDAPGHLFADEETDDFVSFLQLSMLQGWGGYLLPEENCVNAFFSHDEYVDFYGDHPTIMNRLHESLGDDGGRQNETL